MPGQAQQLQADQAQKDQQQQQRWQQVDGGRHIDRQPQPRVALPGRYGGLLQAQGQRHHGKHEGLSHELGKKIVAGQHL